MFILPVLLITVLFNAASLFGLGLQSQEVFLPMIVMLVYGILGSIDDWEGVRGPRRGLGMRARTNSSCKPLLHWWWPTSCAKLTVPQLFWPA